MELEKEKLVKQKIDAYLKKKEEKLEKPQEKVDLDLIKTQLTYSNITAEQVQTNFKMSPEKLIAEMFPKNTFTTYAISSWKKGEIKVSAYKGVEVSCTRTFFLDKKKVEHGGFYLPKNMQGKGIGKAVLKKAVPLYKQLGIKKINTYAADKIGGYVWATAGFQVDKATLSEYKDTLSLWKTDKKIEERIVGLKNIQEIAALKVSKKVFETEFKKYFEMKRRDDEWFSKNYCIDKDGLYRVGKAFLLGESWQGSLNLSNKQQLGFLSNYIGETIKAPSKKALEKESKLEQKKLVKEEKRLRKKLPDLMQNAIKKESEKVTIVVREELNKGEKGQKLLKAIDAWTGTEYTEIRKEQRGEEVSEKTRELSKNFQEALTYCPKYQGPLLRVLENSWEEVQKGDSFSLDAFASFRTPKGDYFPEGKPLTLLKWKNGKGDDLRGVNWAEGEVIVGAKQNFNVISVKKQLLSEANPETTGSSPYLRKDEKILVIEIEEEKK